MKLIPFRDISDNDEFWSGARFIKRYTGLKNVKPDDDFFEYMLMNDLATSDWMACTHIDKYAAGSVISHVNKTTAYTNRHTITAKEFKRSNILEEDLDNWFYHYVEYDRYWTQNLEQLIERLNKIDFHDLLVNSLSIDYSYLILSIDFEMYNGDTKNYDSVTIEFKELIDLKSDKLFLDTESDIEIMRFEYNKKDFFDGKFTFTLDHGKSSFEIKFKCEEIKLIKN